MYSLGRLQAGKDGPSLSHETSSPRPNTAPRQRAAGSRGHGACRTGADLPGASAGAAVVAPAPIPKDEHSWAEPNRVRVTHVKLALTLDFEAHTARGSVELQLERPDPKAPLILDARGLEIEGASGPEGRGRSFQLGKEVDKLGAPFTITLEPGDRQVRIDYRTTPRSEALQWLEPEQTRDRRKPFLFTQGQSILTRTWIPLQDSPGVRVTYEATVRAPTGITAVMSAEQLGQQAEGAWHFRMSQPIPPYLIALAAGDLAFSAISPRSGVWAEPSLVKSARDELADTEAMIQAAEKLFGPVPLGALRHHRLAPVVPLRRHGEPAPHVRHPHHPGRGQVPGRPRRARAGPFLVGQPGHQRHLARLLAQRRLHQLLRAADHGGGIRCRALQARKAARP